MTSYMMSNDCAQCYGCRACEQICPQQAVSIRENSEGFLYPEVSWDKCIDCGLCSRVCPYDAATPTQMPIKAMAVQNKDREALLNSSSGGIFSALADYFLSKNGYIAGCIFDNSFRPIHILADKKDMIEKMRGSKYVQSDLKDIYIQIKNCLKDGKDVLFTGTPCQVDGLNCFLGKQYDSLFTVDLICHGVPSFKIFQQYLESFAQKHGEITDIKFRDKKRNGWCSQGSITYAHKTKLFSQYNESYYYYYYLLNCISRISCYSCKYSTIKRVGDLTIGDYWNFPDDFPNVDSRNGFSAVLINTSKGEKVFSEIENDIYSYTATIDSVVKGNGNLSAPCVMPDLRKTIFERISQEGYETIAKTECKFKYVGPFIRKHFPKKLKRFIKGFLK